MSRLIASIKHNPVRYLGVLASVLVVVIPMFPGLAAVPAVAAVLAAAEWVRANVTANAHIETPTPEQFLDMAIKANVPDAPPAEAPKP